MRTTSETSDGSSDLVYEQNETTLQAGWTIPAGFTKEAHSELIGCGEDREVRLYELLDATNAYLSSVGMQPQDMASGRYSMTYIEYEITVDDITTRQFCCLLYGKNSTGETTATFKLMDQI
jgi:hypothetical protein